MAKGVRDKIKLVSSAGTDAGCAAPGFFVLILY